MLQLHACVPGSVTLWRIRPLPPPPPPPAGEVQLQLDEAVQAVTEAGIHVVVAAGNEDMDACDSSPAREFSAVTVGASSETDQRLWLSPGVFLQHSCCSASATSGLH